jgi:hypothetical protein
LDPIVVVTDTVRPSDSTVYSVEFAFFETAGSAGSLNEVVSLSARTVTQPSVAAVVGGLATRTVTGAVVDGAMEVVGNGFAAVVGTVVATTVPAEPDGGLVNGFSGPRPSPTTVTVVVVSLVDVVVSSAEVVGRFTLVVTGSV